MNPSEVAALAAATGGVTIVVVGDLMLDETLFGSVEQIAPEGPVPLVRLSGTSRSAGGAGNVAENLIALGARVTVIGAVGPDEEGQWLTRRFSRPPAAASTVLVDPARTTPLKRRVVSGGRLLLRMDQEVAREISTETELRLVRAAREALASADVLVLSDYAKGTLPARTVQSLIQSAKEARVPSVVDPKGNSYARYRGATVLTPNRQELQTATRATITQPHQMVAAAEALRRELDVDAMVVKLSEEGILLLRADERPFWASATAQEVFDVTGAGDTVAAVLAAGIALQMDLQSCTELANQAAGVAVSRQGTAAIRWLDLLPSHRGVHADKVIARGRVATLASMLRRAHRRLVFTNGCFDLLHPGHVRVLTEARRQGDVLIVGLNSDASVAMNKGSSRPLVSETSRAHVLAALDVVDFVVIFEEATPEPLIEQIQPNVLVKGADYAPEAVVGADIVRAGGGELVLVPLVEGHSTTSILARAGERKRPVDTAHRVEAIAD